MRHTFSGSFVHAVDEKSRVAMPAAFRAKLGERFMLTKGPDGCLWVIPNERWQMVVSKGAASTLVQRFLVAAATECHLSSKGRFLIPDILREHSDIKPGDDVVIMGLGNRIEIWSRRRWDALSSQLSSDRLRQEFPELFEF